MKRKRLLRMMLDCGAVFVREGGKHSIYKNPRTGKSLSVPRTARAARRRWNYAEVSEELARKLVRDACE